MTNLTLDNWKEKLYELLGTFGHANNSSMVTLTQMFCLDLLSLQKQDLKDEAVKALEYELEESDICHCQGCKSEENGLRVAITIIRNLD